MVVIRKMKEKCKDAARMRREKERVEFVELSKLLPLPSSTTSQLDKASIIRLTSSYLRMRSAFPQGLGENWGTKRRLAHRRNPTGSSPPTGHEELAFRHSLNASAAQQGALAHNATFQSTNQIKELGSLLLQTLDGFVFALHRDGKIMYVSETASVHLGLPQIDLTGSSVFDYIHPADHNDIMDMLNLTELERSELADKEQNHKQEEAEGEEEDRDTIEIGRSFCMRMKCVLPKRNAGLVSNGYKAIHCSGYLKIRCKRAAQASGFSSAPSTLIKRSKLDEGPFAQNSWESYALVAVGHSLLPTASTEIKLGQRTFMFRANLDLRLHHIESQASSLLGFQQTDLIGHSLYQIVHAADLSHLEQAHKQVLDKGQAVSRYHRLMRQDGGYIWVQTHATLVSNPRNIPRPQHVVGICCVIGENLNDDSRALLVDEPPGRLESSSMAAFVAKQSIEKSTVPMKKLKTSQNKSLTKLAPAKTISKRNCNQKQTQPGGQNVDEIKSSEYHQYLAEQQTAQCNYTSETISENCPSRIYQAIGPARRPSDDSCSVVSSVASTMSASSTSCYSYLPTYNKPTTNSLTSSPPSHKMTMMEPDYNYKCASSCAQNQQHFFTSTQSSLSSPVHSDQYSSRIHIPSRNYETQDYWSMQEVHCDQSSLPISIDTSCGQHHSSSLPTKATSSASPPLTISTLAASQVSSDCSLGNVVGASGGYAISPEHPYAGNQYYYRLDSRGYDYIHDDGVLQAYPNETQVYLDYTKIDGRRASISCNAQQSGSYYYTSHYGIAYASENTSA